MHIIICTIMSTGIVLEAYGPLGSPARPGIVNEDPVVMEDPVIKELSVKYNATVGQVNDNTETD